MDRKRISLLIILAWTLVSFLDAYPSFAWASDQNPAQSPAQNPATAQTLLADKKYQAVVDLLSPQVEKLTGPQLRTLGQAYSGLENPGMAMKTFAIALVKNPKDFESKTLLGAEQLRCNKDREALLSLREAIDINPHYEPPYLLIGKIYEKKKNRYELITLYQDMIKRIGEKPMYVSKLCELCAISGLFDDAKSYCRRGIELAKDAPKNYVFLAIAQKDTGFADEAKSLLRRASENFPKSEEAQMAYAQYLDEQKDFIDSARVYQTATQADPSSAKAWLGLANSSLEIQKFQESYDAFRKACDLSQSSLSAVRRAMNILHSVKADDWVPRFDALSESCGLNR